MGANKLFEFHTAFFVKIIIPFFAFPLHPEKRQAAHFHRDFIAKRLLQLVLRTVVGIFVEQQQRFFATAVLEFPPISRPAVA